MTVTKIEDLDCDSFTIDSNNHLITKDGGETINLQFDWLLFNKYGIPKKDTFHLTEESRMLFECPVTKDTPTYKKLKEFNQKIAELLGGCYASMLKEPNIHPPLLKLKIKQDSKFWDDYARKSSIVWGCADDLRKAIRFNSEVRFVVKPKAWHYLGKVGCSLVLKHMEIRAPVGGGDGDVEMLD